MSFYPNEALEEMPAFTDYSMRGRTYRYYGGKVLYPFGYGLGYGRCALQLLGADRGGARVRVRNESGRALEEVVELYLRDEGSPLAPPNPSLCGFRRIRLQAGEEKELTIGIGRDAFTLVDEEGKRIPGSGVWRLWAGFGAPDARTEELSGQKAASVLIN